MKQKIVIFLTVLIIATCIDIYSVETTDALAFTKLSVGAKPISCGGAYHSVAGDVNSIFYNPAGLAELKKFELTTMVGLLSLDRYINMVGLGLPVKFGTVGFGIVNTAVTGIKKYDDNAKLIGETNYQLYNIILSYSKNFQNIDVGVNFKPFIDNLDDNSRIGMGIDVGIISTITNKISLGVKIKDLIGFIGEDKLPLNVVVAAKYTPLEKLNISSDILYNFETKQVNLRAGVLFEVTKLLYIGCGINNGEISFGTGLNLNKFNFYYSFSTDKFNVNNLHFISLGIKL